MYSENLNQNKAAVAALPPRDEATAAGIVRIDKLLAHFHKGGKCHWRSKALRNILWQSEVAMLLATNLHKAKSVMDDYSKSLFTDMLIDLYTFCDKGIVAIWEDPSMESGMRDELIYAFLPNAERKSLKKNSSAPWFFNEDITPIVNILKETFCYPSGLGAIETHNAFWTITNGNTLTIRVLKYGEFMDTVKTLECRALLNVIKYAISILGGKLSDTLFATERHRLTNIATILGRAEDKIAAAKAGHKAIAMITDGKEVAIQYRAIEMSTNTPYRYWSTASVTTDQYRVFTIKGNKKHIEFIAHTGDDGRDNRKDILSDYKSFRNSTLKGQLPSETCRQEEEVLS